MELTHSPIFPIVWGAISAVSSILIAVAAGGVSYLAYRSNFSHHGDRFPDDDVKTFFGFYLHRMSVHVPWTDVAVSDRTLTIRMAISGGADA